MISFFLRFLFVVPRAFFCGFQFEVCGILFLVNWTRLQLCGHRLIFIVGPRVLLISELLAGVIQSKSLVRWPERCSCHRFRLQAREFYCQEL